MTENGFMQEAETVELEVGGPDKNGIYRGEVVRFTGKEVDFFESGQTMTFLYQCPGGFRVYVEDQRKEEQQLYPHDWNSFTGQLDYGFYSDSDLPSDFPQFGATVGVFPVRDID